MKKLSLLALLLALFTLTTFSSCKHQKDAAASSTTVKSDGESGSGTSFSDAIVIQEETETKGVAAEYAWLKKNYPGYKLIKQSLQYNDGKPYDVMEIKTADGDTKKVYFDISNFFGKF